jgi:hypothetical protein
MLQIPFNEFPKIARFNREVIVTEKIDGTNAQILVNDTGDDLIAGSRTRWITPEDDNHGFARWVKENKQELLRLGPGAHFGEWWGSGIQRTYGLKEKRFSLFNVSRWETDRPTCCHVVPVLWRGTMEDLRVNDILEKLRTEGSVAAPGFKNPEGVVIFHVQSGTLFKKTLDKNDAAKGT